MTPVCRVGVVAVLACALLGGAWDAHAQQGWDATPWSLSTPNSTGGSIFAPKVGVDAAGNGVALWSEPGPTPFGISPTVRTARYSAATRQWSSPQTLSATRNATAIDIVVDGAGNALALWRSNAISVAINLYAARYDVINGQWTDVELTSTFTLLGAAVAMNAAGDAVACWTDSTSLRCRRYGASSASWSAEETLAASATLPDVAIDAARNAVAVWSVGTTTVQSARFDAVAGTWSAAVDLATGLTGPMNPGARVAMNDAGDAAAAWSQDGAISAARMPAGGGPWTAAVELAPSVTNNEAARLVVDSAGRVTVAWVSTTIVRATATRAIQAARWDAGAWSQGASLPDQTGFAYGPPSIATDGAGNVHVVWSQSLASPQIRLLASRYAVTTGQWTTVTNLSALNQSAYNTDVAIDSHGNAVAIWFQTASGFSVPQALRWTATPAAPTIEDVVPSPGALTLGVALPPSSDPSLAPTTLDYSLDGGQTWQPRVPAGVTRLLRIDGLIDGQRYTLRLRAVSAAGPGEPTAAIGVRSGAVGSPQFFRVSARSGARATFAWVAPAAGLEPTNYILRATGVGSAVPIAQISTGGPATQFTVVLPPGAFAVSVLAVAGSAFGQSSGPLVVSESPNGLAVPPQDVLASVAGATVALSWTLPLESPVPSRLEIVVAGAPPLRIPIAVSESVVVPGVPAAAYSLRVDATSPLGGTAASDAFEVQVPGTCVGLPQAPRAFSVTTQGGVVYLDWLPPATGGAVSSYVLHVTGAIAATLPLTARTLAVPVPAGAYDISVASVGLCGTSAFTPPQTVVVP